jgi:hypothetical protein
MTSTLLSTRRKPIPLTFIPEMYHEPFIEAILRQYAVAAEYSMYSTKEKHHIPELMADIAGMNVSFFLVGALACETGNPTEFHDRMDDSVREGDFSENVDELWEQYNPRDYGDYHDDFAEDIETIFNYYHISYMTVHHNVFSGKISYYPIHNYALVGVW